MILARWRARHPDHDSLDLERRGTSDTHGNLDFPPFSSPSSLPDYLLAIHGFGNFAELGPHTSGDNEAASATLGDLRTGEDHVFLVADGAVNLGEGVRLLGNGKRLREGFG